MTYGVMVNGEFDRRELIDITAKGFKEPMLGREGTYDQYVMNEIDRSYGDLGVFNCDVLDIGGNIGCFTKWAVEHGAKSVVTLEPEPNNFKMLDKNVGDFDSVKLYDKGLHPVTDGPSVIYLSPTGKNPGNTTMTKRRGRTETTIELMSVGRLKELHPKFHVAKIDCEGAEYDLVPELLKVYPDIFQVSLELHIAGFSVDHARWLHNYMINEGFYVVGKEPKLEQKVWATLATYAR